MWRVVLEYAPDSPYGAETLVIDAPEPMFATFGEGMVRVGPERKLDNQSMFAAELWLRNEYVSSVRIYNLDRAAPDGFPPPE